MLQYQNILWIVTFLCEDCNTELSLNTSKCLHMQYFQWFTMGFFNYLHIFTVARSGFYIVKKVEF